MSNTLTRPLSDLPFGDFHALALKQEIEAAVGVEVLGFVKGLTHFDTTFGVDPTPFVSGIDTVIGAHLNVAPPDPDAPVPMKFRRVGDLYTITPQGAEAGPVLSIFDFPITTEIEIEAGAYTLIGDGHMIGDNVTMEVIDKDGVLQAVHGAPAGVVVSLHRMLDHEYVNPELHEEIRIGTLDGDTTTVLAGLYLRMKYESYNTDPAATPKISIKYQIYEP